ncbi:MAG: hypothetical protein C5B49_12265 [Bdellovibrio sp.]|nr:MAG: hypothetical protein C5B49_12265 [Bdellovibrio sp.]
MKRIILGFSTLAMISGSALPVAAQTAAAPAPATAPTGATPVPVVAPSPTGSVFLGQAGDYKVETYDQSKIDSMFVQHYSDRQNQDRDFVIGKQKDIANQLKGLVDDLNKPQGLVSMAVKSTARQSVDLTQFVGAREEVIATINRIDAEVEGIFLLPSVLEKAAQDVQLQKEEIRKLPQPLRVGLEGLKQLFIEQKKKFLSQVDTKTYFLVLPNGVIKDFQYNADFSNLPVPAEKLEEMRMSALQDRAKADNEDIRNMLKEFNLMAVTDIRGLRVAFGTSQTYRWQVNKKGKEINFERLGNIFLARDYLRYTYGTQLGAILIDYNKMIANLDAIFTGNTSILKYISVDFPTNNLTEYQDKIANALNAAEKRNEEVFGQGVALLDRIMSGYTFLRGQSQLAEVNIFVLKLLENDILHEIMLMSPGGSRQMREDFRNVYMKDPAKEKNTRAVVADLRALMKAPEGTPGNDSDTGAILGGTFMGTYKIAVAALDTVVDFLEQARLKEAGYEALRANSQTKNVIDHRGDL